MVYSENSRQSLTEVSNLASVMQMAQAGYFRAIAQWINVYLLPQGIYAQVCAAPQSGYLLIQVEFQRMPERDRLIRFICYRLVKLNSKVIHGVRICGRYIGTMVSVWDISVRLSPPNHRLSSRIKTAQPIKSANRNQSKQRIQSRGRKRTTTPSALAIYQSPAKAHRRRPSAPLLNPQLWLLSTTAVAAFLVGCILKVLTLYLNTMPADVLQAQAGASEQPPLTIQTALETIQVRPLQTTQRPQDRSVTLSFGSDRAVSTAAHLPTPQPEQKPAIAPDAYQADVTLTSLEAPPQRGRASGTAGLAPPSVQSLRDEGVDVINLASDEMLRDGSAELTRLLRQLEQAGIHPVGAGRNQREARRPEIIDVRGQRIAYLGYSDSDAHAAAERRAGTNPGLDNRVAADIQAIRNQVDWVIVNYHWNHELTEYPSLRQTNLARFAIDQGADLVVGYHPSVLQGAEVYKGRAIAYSLGNFIFADSTPIEENYDTAVLKVSLRPHQMRLEFLPVQVRQSQPKLVNQAKAAEILSRLHEMSEPFEQPMRSPIVLEARSHTPIPTATPEVSPAHSPDDLPAPAPENALPIPKEAAPEKPQPPVTESLSPAGSATTTPAGAPSLPSSESPSPSERLPFTPSDSFITYPDSPPADSFIRYPEDSKPRFRLPLPLQRQRDRQESTIDQNTSWLPFTDAAPLEQPEVKPTPEIKTVPQPADANPSQDNLVLTQDQPPLPVDRMDWEDTAVPEAIAP